MTNGVWSATARGSVRGLRLIANAAMAPTATSAAPIITAGFMPSTNCWPEAVAAVDGEHGGQHGDTCSFTNAAAFSFAPSQDRTSLRSFVTGFCHSGPPVAALRRRPRHEGSQRQRARGSVATRALQRVRNVDAGRLGLASSRPSTPSVPRPKAKWGHKGDTNVRRVGVCWAELGSPRQPRKRPASGSLEPNTGQSCGCRRRGLEPPTRGL